MAQLREKAASLVQNLSWVKTKTGIMLPALSRNWGHQSWQVGMDAQQEESLAQVW